MYTPITTMAKHYPKFYIEQLQNDVAMQKRWLRQAEEKLQNALLNKQDSAYKEYAALWELECSLIDLNEEWSKPNNKDFFWLDNPQYTHKQVLNIHITKKLTPQQAEELYETIDQVLTDNDYRLNEKKSNDKELVYGPITINVSSSVCSSVPTGRKVPEYKTDCSFIEGGA